MNGSKPTVIFAHNERYINAAYQNHSTIIFIWLFISALIFLKAVLERKKLRHLILHASREITSTEAIQILADCQARLKLKKKIRIYSANANISAFTYGLIQPMIVIPEKYNSKELELTILHELAHIKRKDSFILFLRTLTMGIYWFNPLIYPICRKTNTLCELACDELVTKNMKETDKRSYSHLIITSANDRHLSSSHIAPFSENQKIIKERIDLIMADKQEKGRPCLRPLILSAGILLTSTFSVFAYEPPNELTMLDGNTNEELLSSISSDNFVEFTTDNFSGTTASVPENQIEYDSQFTDKNGTIQPADKYSGQADCNHSYIDGIFSIHIKDDHEGCIVENYNANYCTKCSHITSGELESTYTYITCPHKTH